MNHKLPHQIENIEEEFYEILELINPQINESAEQYSEEVMEEVMEYILQYFIENYKIPTIKESYLGNDDDINDQLYEELLDVLLDESLGSIVAAARHGWGLSRLQKQQTDKINKMKGFGVDMTGKKPKAIKGYVAPKNPFKKTWNAARAYKLQGKVNKIKTNLATKQKNSSDLQKKIDNSVIGKTVNLAGKAVVGGLKAGIHTILHPAKTINNLAHGAVKMAAKVLPV